jgi:hypothetical protein
MRRMEPVQQQQQRFMRRMEPVQRQQQQQRLCDAWNKCSSSSSSSEPVIRPPVVLALLTSRDTTAFPSSMFSKLYHIHTLPPMVIRPPVVLALIRSSGTTAPSSPMLSKLHHKCNNVHTLPPISDEAASCSSINRVQNYHCALTLYVFKPLNTYTIHIHCYPPVMKPPVVLALLRSRGTTAPSSSMDFYFTILYYMAYAATHQ